MQEFEDCGFCAGNYAAGVVHFSEADLLVQWGSGGDGVGDYVDVVSLVQQVVGCLVDADVGLDAAEDDLPAV